MPSCLMSVNIILSSDDYWCSLLSFFSLTHFIWRKSSAQIGKLPKRHLQFLVRQQRTKHSRKHGIIFVSAKSAKETTCAHFPRNNCSRSLQYDVSTFYQSEHKLFLICSHFLYLHTNQSTRLFLIKNYGTMPYRYVCLGYIELLLAEEPFPLSAQCHATIFPLFSSRIGHYQFRVSEHWTIIDRQVSLESRVFNECPTMTKIAHQPTIKPK